MPSQAEFLARMGSDERNGKGMAVVAHNAQADMVFWQLRQLEAACLLGS
jgi:hypothetical protein